MDIRIVETMSGGEVEAIPSKSQAHRLLICAALADAETYIQCGEVSDDILATIECLESLGAQISHDGAGFKVKPITFPVAGDEPITQFCGMSGSTLRFMLPICCALGVSAEFIMQGGLPKRPMAPVLEQLAANGCEIINVGQTVAPNDPQASPHEGDSQSATGERDLPLSESDVILRCSGKLNGGVYELPGDISSQFVSGLLLALPLISDASVISIICREESRPYIAMTLDAINIFGIKTKRFTTNPARGAAYRIKGSQSYTSPGKLAVEGDWSCAANWLCAGAIGSGVTCTGLNLGSTQGDMAILRLLTRFGASVAYESHSVTVTPARLRGIQIDAIDTPDLVPALSVVASVAEGETVIYNAARLRLKESDRLRVITQTLSTLGANITETKDGLIIKGKSSLQGGTVSSQNDHRIAMMAAIASIVCENPVTITDAKAVNKSYPRFFRDFEALGGKVDTL